MSSDTRILVNYLVTLSEWMLSVSDTQAKICRLLAEFPAAEQVRSQMLDGIAKSESGHEQIEAVLHALKDVLAKQKPSGLGSPCGGADGEFGFS